MTINEVPRYTDGEPANLEAAAMDALEWLRWIQSLGIRGERENQLSRAIAKLEEYIPDTPPIFESSETAAIDKAEGKQ